MSELELSVNQRPIIVVMGVSGCGKTSVGCALAKKLGLPFAEGDDYHSTENIAKMTQGTALEDSDRWPWLEALCLALNQLRKESGGAVASCSALKRRYRDFISERLHDRALFVFLEGDAEMLYERLKTRSDHFMPSALLRSQLENLERPEADEPVIVLPANKAIDALVEEIAQGNT